MSKLATEFDEAMENVYLTAKDECGYNATGFLQMLYEHRGVETARRLLSGDKPQFGFTKLWECSRLDLTVECLVLNERFRELFDSNQLETARRRLREYGFDPKRCERAHRRPQ